MSEPVIATEDLTVTYGRHRGIVEVNLAVEEGEVFGFLGPNGAGKTTAQRVLLDIIRPTRGRVTVSRVTATTPIFADHDRHPRPPDRGDHAVD